ncbi:hypothetical protein KBTX_00750 [wastewater metagenome]|uniref:Invasion associated locus B (IalB) protein n=2 Tax=unclassified sequences TaxID=12908 RepID=A0A5B8RAL3_9ZZZZ|nr:MULTISPECIES: invasion associated locus B family protein [Arhodomonas]MCS4503564.1 invasion associated locus B family protein [Arhodomonas aquaeolei]QEA04442.1 hypothetical protein KBTEX_00750 [uncultured organism]
MRYLKRCIGLALILVVGAAQAQSGSGGLLDNGGRGGESDFLKPAENGGQTAQQTTQGQPQGQQGDSENVERFEDWGVRCGLGDNGPRNGCEMFQGVTRSDNDKLVMRVAVAYPPQEQVDGPVAVFQLPLGIHLPPGVQMSIDGGEPIRFPVQICFQAGCRADLPLKDELLAKLKGGTKAQVSIRVPNGKTVNLPLSLMGFTAALDRISP